MALHQEQVNVVCNTNEASTHFECRTSKHLAAGEQVRAAFTAMQYHAIVFNQYSCLLIMVLILRQDTMDAY